MKVFIANFGLENRMWPRCLKRSVVTTFEDEDLHGLWLAGDKAGYVERCVATKRTARGISPTRQVASRWFNLARIVESTQGDLWLHREKEQLWWTISGDGPAATTLESSPGDVNQGVRIYVIEKPAAEWSNLDRRGIRLEWSALHPKAQQFLFTEGTLQELSPDHADYARTLVDGGDLNPWHSRAQWRAVESARGRSAVRILSARERAAARMVDTAMRTVASANGQQELRTIKEKNAFFPNDVAFREYVAALIEAQDGLCAISELPLQFDGEDDDPQLLCSLDRIDSADHYRPGNFQVVCKFINQWKGASDDSEFRRLIGVVRSFGRPPAT